VPFVPPLLPGLLAFMYLQSVQKLDRSCRSGASKAGYPVG
jgi:hypothetical protein